MWRSYLVIVAAACFSCQSVSMVETAIDSKNPRLGNTVKYFKTSWADLISGVDMVEVEKSAAGATSLGLTTDTNVAIVVHGRESSAGSEFASTLKFSLCAADRAMVIIMVDWSYLSHSSYAQSVAIVPSIAADLKDFIVLLNAANLNRDQLHLIGFDLGAHVMGITSRNAAARAIKITALDPAGDRWDASSLRLRPNDAEYVEVIHTDITGYGVPDAIGTLDIYPNGGARQPGCAVRDNACHHNRAWQFFAATVDTGGHLVALRCPTMTQVNNNRCVGGPAVFMGTLSLIKIQRGLYRVNTGYWGWMSFKGPGELVEIGSLMTGRFKT